MKNGTLGEIVGIESDQLAVRIVGPDEREIRFDTKNYRHLDYGYAATVHKGQGATVDRSVVLATPGFDRHLTYVSLSRHRDAAESARCIRSVKRPASRSPRCANWKSSGDWIGNGSGCKQGE